MAFLDSVPTEFVAGDTWEWTGSFADYPAGTWTVVYYFENADDNFQVIGAPSGTDHSFSVDATTTADIETGSYRWFARATSGTTVKTIADENGWLKILTDPAASGDYDWRSSARKLADALDDFFEKKISGKQLDQISMSIAGRSISRMSLPELWAFKKQVEQEADASEAGSSAGIGRDMLVRFV